jgi:hypothetical protein
LTVSRVALIHLVWAPLGTLTLARFLSAYERNDPGAAHRLHVVLNGFDDEASLAGHRQLLSHVDHEELVLPAPGPDLAAYKAALAGTGAPWICFVNSYAEPLVPGWLEHLLAAARAPGVGLVGATGSYESAYSAAPRWRKPLLRRHFPQFPNPHVRSSSFVIARGLAEALDWPPPRRKQQALQLESGRAGLSAQVVARGMRLAVAGREGAVEVADWPASRTFRSGAQENLLVADNRTRQYAEADPAERHRLAAMAWGDAASV